MDGLQLAAKLRHALRREVAVIILTGDLSTATLGDIAHGECIRLSKPVKVTQLNQAIERLLPRSELLAILDSALEQSRDSSKLPSLDFQTPSLPDESGLVGEPVTCYLSAKAATWSDACGLRIALPPATNTTYCFPL